MEDILKGIGDGISQILNDPTVQTIFRATVLYVGLIWLAAAYWAYRDLRTSTNNPLLPYGAAAAIILFTPIFFPLAVVLYLLTPVHYYFSALVLLLLAGPEEAREPGYALTWTALLAWSAAGYAALLATDSRAFVNSAILSAGLFAVLVVHCVAWRRAASPTAP